MKKESICIKYPKYYRQRFIITLLQCLNRSFTWDEFQKILFLSQQETEIFYYDFVFCNGLHSFQAASDLEVLHSSGWIELESNKIFLLHNLPRENGLTQLELKKIFLFTRKNSFFKEQSLFSIYSNSHEDESIDRESILFTIGYEGISIEEYVNKLLRNNIRLICDVRMNPISRKFGFSRKNLSELLPKFGIEYLHIPELGIISSSRKELHNDSDYQQLFNKYKKELIKKDKFLEMIVDAFFKYKKIALTCFENKPSLCHRHCISDYLQEEKKIKVIHL